MSSTDWLVLKTDLPVRSLITVLHGLQHIAVEVRVRVAAEGQTSTARHQNLQVQSHTQGIQFINHSAQI